MSHPTAEKRKKDRRASTTPPTIGRGGLKRNERKGKSYLPCSRKGGRRNKGGSIIPFESREICKRGIWKGKKNREGNIYVLEEKTNFPPEMGGKRAGIGGKEGNETPFIWGKWKTSIAHALFSKSQAWERRGGPGRGKSSLSFHPSIALRKGSTFGL